MTIKVFTSFFSLLMLILPLPVKAFAQEWKSYTKDNTIIPGNNIYCIAVDNLGIKWFGTDGGLVKFDGKDWKLYTINFNQNTTIKPVNDLKFESNSNQSLLWIATDDGISLLDITNPESPSFNNFYNIVNSGLIANGVKKIVIDQGQVKWFGTFQGLSSLCKSSWASYSTQNYWIEHDKVVSLSSGPDSMVYIGTEGAGVSRLKMQSVDAITSASPLDRTWTGADEPDKGKLTSNNIYSILIEQNGYQWFGTDKGVAVHTSYNTKRDWKNYTVNDGLIDDYVQAICKENKNTIWFGTPKGVSRFDGITWKNFTTTNGLAHNNVRDIAIDNEGSLWFATEGGISVLTNTLSTASHKKLLLSGINCFPNPFHLQTTIAYTLNAKANVKIDVYGMNGRHILALANELQTAGEHRFTWNTINSAGNIVPPGVYIAQLSIGEQPETHTILLINSPHAN